MSTHDDACAAALARIQRKLEKWELHHLREHARHLDERIEALEAELMQVRDNLANAEDRAEWWREQVMSITEQLAEDSGAGGLQIGITRDGHLGLVQKDAA